jgi:hypothetical protein
MGAIQPVADLEAPIWERQPGESSAAYEFFRAFRNLPPAERSLAEACRRHGKRSEVYASKLNVRWRWLDRARAHDAWIESIRRDERERGVRADERLKMQRQKELQELEYETALRMLRRSRTVIDLPVVTVQRDVVDEDGMTVHRTVINPIERLTLRDAAATFLTASRRARLVLDMYGDPARTPTPENGVEDTSDVDAWLAETTREPMEQAKESTE